MRRVVVTGLGLVTPLGCGHKHTWSRLLNGESGIRGIQSFDTSDLPVKIAGQVPAGNLADGYFNADEYVIAKDRRRMGDFIVFAMAAAQQAVEDAGWKPTDNYELERTGVLVGSGIGGLVEIGEGAATLNADGPRKISPFFIPSALINLASGQISIKYGYKGPNHSVVTACSTGAHAIGDAARMIALDDADVMIAGGAEATGSDAAHPPAGRSAVRAARRLRGRIARLVRGLHHRVAPATGATPSRASVALVSCRSRRRFRRPGSPRGRAAWSR
jgi:3-oxoacyl-[acyl-carrier-protein] synthase II